MKKSHKKVLIISVILLALAALIVFVCEAVKTKDDIAKMIQKELALTEEETGKLSYVGEFVDDDSSLLWFTIQNGIYYENRYISVECRVVADGRYLVEGVSKCGAWGPDIAIASLGIKDICLIYNPDCRGFVFTTMGGGTVISKTELSPDDLPYIFECEWPAKATELTFLNEEGNELPWG